LSDYLGWLATVVFVASYFCPRQSALRTVQMLGAGLWIVYGLHIGASPVVVANTLVFGAAAWTTLRRSERRAAGGHHEAPRTNP